MTVSQPTNRTADLDRAAHHTWSLFLDWCDATGVPSLPADTETVAEFLGDHPAQRATQRRRVSTINAVHRAHSLAEPGRSAAVRQALGGRRERRRRAIAQALADRISLLPTSGWTQGLFGRRDALILTLVAAGLTYRDVSALRRGDIDQRGATLVVKGRDLPPIDGLSTAPAYSPLAVFHRWARVQTLMDRVASVRVLADYLRQAPEAAPASVEPLEVGPGPAKQPLIVTIDRWGATPLSPAPMTPQSIATISRDHLANRAPSHWMPTQRNPGSDFPVDTTVAGES